MTTNPHSTASIGGHPIHPMLIPFPVAFLVAAFVTDLAFWGTGNAAWAQASMWLIGAGVVMGALAAVAGLTDFLGDGRIRALSDAWHHFLGNGTAVVLAIINFFLRYSEGAAPAIRPWGLVLSLIVVLIFLYTGWKGWEMVYRHRVGVMEAPDQLSGTPTGTRPDNYRHAA